MGMVVGRVDFGDGKGARKLKGTSAWMRWAVEESKRSIFELANDPVGGWPYLVRALVNGGAVKPITLMQADTLIDSYKEANNGWGTLGDEIAKAIAGYMHIELTKPEDEESSAPNAGSQAETSRSSE